MKIMKQDAKIQKLVIEVMKHVRQQTYTPEQLSVSVYWMHSISIIGLWT